MLDSIGRDRRTILAFSVFLLLIAVCTPSCLVRRRVVTRQGKHDNRPLLTASKDQLLARIRSNYDQINTFDATMDLTPSVGSVYKGEISEFPSVRGYVLYKKPADIRIIGLDPVIHTKAFDMVSTGNDFRLLLPSKNLFIEGLNDAPATSKNKLENLRPEAFLQAMLIEPARTEERPVLEDDTDEEHALYVLMFLEGRGDQLWLRRSVYFDRLTLQIVRQKMFDKMTDTVSDVRYSDWGNHEGVQFPGTIDINRPKDGYGVVMKVVGLKINMQLAADKFELTRPEGTKLEEIGTQSATAPKSN